MCLVHAARAVTTFIIKKKSDEWKKLTIFHCGTYFRTFKRFDGSLRDSTRACTNTTFRRYRTEMMRNTLLFWLVCAIQRVHSAQGRLPLRVRK